MDADEYETTEPYATNAEVVGSAPGVSMGNYMLSISAALSREVNENVNMAFLNNMTALAVASQGVNSLLSLNSRKQEVTDILGLVQQATARE